MKRLISLLFKIPARNIRRHARRSAAALILIAAGFTALNLFEGYIQFAERMFEVTYSQRLMYGDLLIQRQHAFTGGLSADPAEQLDVQDQKQIEQVLSDIHRSDNFVRFLNFTGLVTNGENSSVFIGYAYDLLPGAKMRGPNWAWNTLAGHPLDTSAPDSDQVVIGQGLGHLMNCRATSEGVVMDPEGHYPPVARPFSCAQPGLQISATSPTGQMTAATLQVAGIIDAVYRELDLRNVVLSLPRAQSLLGSQNITFYSVRAASNSTPALLGDDLNQVFTAKKLPFVALSWKKHPYGEIFVQSMDFLGVFRTFTILVVLAIVTLSILSTLVRLVQERTREIGTLRCIGFRSRQILGMFMAEVLMLAISGCTIGMAATATIATVVNHLGIRYQIGILSEKVPMQIDLSLRNFLLAASLLTLLALLAGLLATRRALKLSIPNSLASN